MRYAARIDNTSAAIVSALRQVGAKVIHIKWPFDFLVLFRGRVFLMDAKTPQSKKGTIRKKPSQVKLEAEGWPLAYVRTASEALHVIGCVDQREADLPSAADVLGILKGLR